MPLLIARCGHEVEIPEKIVKKYSLSWAPEYCARCRANFREMNEEFKRCKGECNAKTNTNQTYHA